ncbi:hypothetical protein JZ751_015497 [Albula glossodonta]|uniref:Uncharacterized protein n=1 Tax=Albula glossodonta TaxID=121402 RepID=A0A8T2MX98_9TELE|nr:hypothetical protein JZ751_015497 [Albula glossodonta]
METVTVPTSAVREGSLLLAGLPGNKNGSQPTLRAAAVFSLQLGGACVAFWGEGAFLGPHWLSPETESEKIYTDPTSLKMCRI